MVARKTSSTVTRTRKKTTKKTPAKRRSRKNNAATLAEEILNPVKPVKPVTHVAILLDKSASMSNHRQGAIRAFNDLLQPIKERANEQDIGLTFFQFGSPRPQVFLENKADLVNPITLSDYFPADGGTDLYGTIGGIIHHFKGRPDANDPNASFLVIIITDGEDNENTYSPFQIRNWIQECQATDRWTFVISCPNKYVSHISRKLDIPEGNIQGWDTTSHFGMETVRTAQTAGLQRYIATRATGQGSTKTFFEVNVGRQGVRQVTKDLVPESPSRFKRLKVNKAGSVKDFIESKKLKFELGRTFYALSKPETIQHHKEIILQRRDNPAKMYGGHQVRDKLGIPHGQDGRVVPGNLGEWVVWVQSTSPNRKLLAGMEVLYDTNPVVSNTGHGAVLSR